MALFAKAGDAGYAQRNVAQDYAAIGSVADQVRLMGYDYHWATSPPGPVAPVNWIQAGPALREDRDPAEKDRSGASRSTAMTGSAGTGTSVAWLPGLPPGRPLPCACTSTRQQTPDSPTPTPRATTHRLVRERPERTAKFDVARQAAIGGVYLWLYGYGTPYLARAASRPPVSDALRPRRAKGAR